MMSNDTPRWQKIAILVSAFGAFVAALVAGYQGILTRKTVAIDQAITRPFLVIEPSSKTEYLNEIILQTKNTGDIPGRILYESGKSWIDSIPLRTGIDTYSKHIIYPNETVILSHVKLDNPEAIWAGEVEFKIALAVLYETISKDDERRWIAECWLFYNPHNEKLEVWERDEIQVSPNTDKCDIEALMPVGWLDQSKPHWNNSQRR
jgi:hypothetical protein